MNATLLAKSNFFAVTVISLLLVLGWGQHALAAKDTSYYERARAVRFGKLKAGVNTFSISAVVRNHSDGTLTAEDGRGHAMAVPREGLEPSLTRCAPWMDEAQVILNPGPASMDLMEIRVFEPKTGKVFFDVDPVCSTNGAVLLRATTPLPDKLDLWFHAHSYSATDQVYRLPCRVGASVQAGSGSFRVAELQPARPPEGNVLHPAYYRIEGVGALDHERSQVCAVTKRGVKVWPDDFVSFQGSATVYTHLDLADIGHFEIRPFGGSYKFYFPGVKLPRRNGLSAPPPITVEIAGREVDVMNNELVPIRIRTLKGARSTGAEAHGTYCLVNVRDPQPGDEARTTLLYNCDEMRFGTPVFKAVDLQGQPLEDGMGASAASTAGAIAGARIFNCPLTNIGKVTIEFKPFQH